MVSLQYIEVFSCQRDLTEILDTVQISTTHPISDIGRIIYTRALITHGWGCTQILIPYLCHPYQYGYLMRVIELMISRVTCPLIKQGTTPLQ